ncbi:IS3 family transposase [Colwellia demingiae]|uniref:IS3 family transposase n=1 Tax=Colwellia demingiae TaxID=89401 RepID=A0A5C6Q848_9GAMM|nr:IS3-like element ISCps9 family transposase [Colwellia demingiae]TWX65185.1 IS3 family transposase [Colwellia demingiae]
MPRYTQPKKTWFYPVNFKIKAVELSLRNDMLSKDVAQALDIHPLMLSRWRKEYREGKFKKNQRYQSNSELMSKIPTKKELNKIKQLQKENDRLKMENDLLKKATVSGGSPSERFGFIEKHKEALGVKYLCSWLDVSRSGFYAWRRRPRSMRAINDADLLLNIKKVFNNNHQTYGSPRVFHALKREGITTSEKRVARLMRENGLRARALKTYSRPAKVKLFYKAIKNNRKNISKPDAINQQWSGDITYLKVGARWYYLAVVLDLFSRRIIGWAFGQNKSTALTLKALQLAIKKRKPTQPLLFHTDRGAEYRAHVVQQFLVKHNITASMNRPGCCTDNAEVESFFHSLKADLIRGNVFATTDKLHSKLKGYMNYFYNRQRLHSSLGYKTPAEFELAVN